MPKNDITLILNDIETNHIKVKYKPTVFLKKFLASIKSYALIKNTVHENDNCNWVSLYTMCIVKCASIGLFQMEKKAHV